jgi:hypothetical protein
MRFDRQSRSWRETFYLFAILFAIKIIGLLFDPAIRFFFGDSGTYLWSASTGAIPMDRSFVYGYFIRATAFAVHSMYALAFVQSLFGAITACLLFRILRDSFDVPRVFAGLLALALTLEPAQLFFERMVMAESVGTTMFAVMLYSGLAWLRRPHWGWILSWAVAGILAVALRMSLLPVVLGFAMLPVLVAMTDARSRQATLRFVPALVFSLVATLALHSAFKHLYGKLHHSRPDYIEWSGSFRLGLVAPLVTREEVIRAGLPPDLLDKVGPPLRDPRTREAQIWAPDGLIARVNEATNGNQRVARKLAAYALRDHPFGLFRLAWSTLKDYFDGGVTTARMIGDSGDRPVPEDLLEKMQRCCDYDARGLETRKHPITRYFMASRVWLTACYFGLLPLALVMLFVQWRRVKAAALLLAATCAGLVLSMALFSHIVSFRYLHPMPFLVFLCLGAALSPVMIRLRFFSDSRVEGVKT